MRTTCSFLFLLLTFHLTAQELNYRDSILFFRQKYMKDLEAIQGITDGHAYFRFFEPDIHYRITAQFTPSLDTSNVVLATYSGKSKNFLLYGYADFRLRGKRHRLYLYRSRKLMTEEKYKDDLFLPFTDKTCGKESYICRYLDLKISEIKNGRIIIDFNKSYNPYCAYSDGWNCPVPPAVNELKIPVKAGEMKYLRPELPQKH